MKAIYFPPGALVLVDRRYPAKVREAFPEGSTSYAFPHYKLNMVDGDQNVAVALARVGIDRDPASDERDEVSS